MLNLINNPMEEFYNVKNGNSYRFNPTLSRIEFRSKLDDNWYESEDYTQQLNSGDFTTKSPMLINIETENGYIKIDASPNKKDLYLVQLSDNVDVVTSDWSGYGLRLLAQDIKDYLNNIDKYEITFSELLNRPNELFISNGMEYMLRNTNVLSVKIGGVWTSSSNSVNRMITRKFMPNILGVIDTFTHTFITIYNDEIVIEMEDQFLEVSFVLTHKQALDMCNKILNEVEEL